MSIDSMGNSIRLTKVQIAVEFVLDSGEDSLLEPCTYGPVTLTPKEWSTFNLADAIQKEIVERLDSKG